MYVNKLFLFWLILVLYPRRELD